jgi:hypothetical protein
MTDHDRFINTISTLTRHYRELERINGAGFNLFRILGVGNEELKHSLFLAELLNPKGSHGQGAIFLQLFTDMLAIQPFHATDATVEVEKSIGRLANDEGGRLDLFIADGHGNNIVIENKIYAYDQPKQLVRYYQYAPQHVLYLTPDGHEPSPGSTTGDNIQLEADKHYRIISYQEHILQWLELCRKESASLPLLREGISHYINQIKHITGQTENTTMSNEIINVSLQSPENLRSAVDIANNMNATRAQHQWRFWKALREALEKEGLVIEENDKTVMSAKTWNFYFKKEMYYGLWIEIYKMEDISIHWGFEIEHNVYSGFTVEKKGTGGGHQNFCPEWTRNWFSAW